jgi:hypothetical protein
VTVPAFSSFTDHVTAVLLAPWTFALNWVVWFKDTLAVVGLMLMLTLGGGGEL